MRRRTISPGRRRTILIRRLVAVAVAGATTALIWILLFSGGDDRPPSAQAELTPATLSAKTIELLAGLRTGEKAEQLVLAALPPDADQGPPIGGILLDARSWPGAEPGTRLIAKLRDAADETIPPLVATAQEGGPYRELADLPPAERAIEIGDRGAAKAAEDWGELTAAPLAAAGFDLNLGPVADVATLDSPIADRAFSDDPAVAAAMTAAALRGCRRGGIACAPGHFPGLGGASQDTDSGPATVSVDRTTLLGRDVAPFAAAIRGGARAVVVSHALYAAYDPVTQASLSPQILDGLLRVELGFEGVAITDDLSAGAIRSGHRVPEAAVAAIAAGADMVQVGDPAQVGATVRALAAAIGGEEISDRRADDAVGRVLELKRSLGLLNGR
jgi:beta-N-acetylhexosaminidase